MLKAYITLTICLLTDLILYLTQGISLAGQWPDRLLFWSWLLSTILLIVKYNQKKWARIYAGFLIFLTFGSLFPMGIPFLSLIAFSTSMDHEIRVEDYSVRLYAESVIAIPKLAIIKREILTERIIAKPEAYLEIDEESYRFSDVDSIQFHPQRDSLTFIFFIHEHLIEKSISK